MNFRGAQREENGHVEKFKIRASKLMKTGIQSYDQKVGARVVPRALTRVRFLSIGKIIKRAGAPPAEKIANFDEQTIENANLTA